MNGPPLKNCTLRSGSFCVGFDDHIDCNHTLPLQLSEIIGGPVLTGTLDQKLRQITSTTIQEFLIISIYITVILLLSAFLVLFSDPPNLFSIIAGIIAVILSFTFLLTPTVQTNQLYSSASSLLITVIKGNFSKFCSLALVCSGCIMFLFIPRVFLARNRQGHSDLESKTSRKEHNTTGR